MLGAIARRLLKKLPYLKNIKMKSLELFKQSILFVFSQYNFYPSLEKCCSIW